MNTNAAQQRLVRVAFRMPNGVTGHGVSCLNHPELQLHVDQMNRLYGVGSHWIETCGPCRAALSAPAQQEVG